ncbi:HNH endonuclease [Streptomyces sp. NPDC008150]|uniref:HNH endonuclease n=1 Tax=Streptomyces sp. NPDC008150 TaxID=3364816 RepID=UPI0036EE38B0
MGLGEVTRAGVLAAVHECQCLGREAFRRRHGFGQATTYELVMDGDRYDSKAVVGVAHLYSAGKLLSAGDFSGGAHTVARRLRDLGFTVHTGATTVTSDGERKAAPQMVLQPRGGPRERGPQNFAKSVRQGIRLADVAHVLGDHAEVLNSLYPGGVARLWGATPTTERNNEKVRALRGRRVGDDVFFYTEKNFFARATILDLFDSPLLAKEIWGTKQDGSTWEHIMALGEVEEFSTPVLAGPILQLLNAPQVLRMLTLRSAEDYRRVVHLLPRKPGPGLPRPLNPVPPEPARLTRRELLRRLRSLNTHRRAESGTPSRHQPLSLLWAISRITAGKPRLAPWSVFRSEVGPLLSEFGLPGSKTTPEYPFWHLKNSGLWEVHGATSDDGPMPQVGMFNTVQPVAGLTHASAELLRDPPTRLEAVVSLCGTYLADIDQRGLLNSLGLAGYATADGLFDGDEEESDKEAGDSERAAGPAARRDFTVSRPVRDPAIVRKVKDLHGNACQICNAQLQYKRKPYSEAAHIRGLGSPHDGPDELANLLCLCPNHHVSFDGLEIYVDVDGTVKETHSDKTLGKLQSRDGHQVDRAYLQYHRTLCELNRLTSR